MAFILAVVLSMDTFFRDQYFLIPVFDTKIRYRYFSIPVLILILKNQYFSIASFDTLFRYFSIPSNYWKLLQAISPLQIIFLKSKSIKIAQKSLNMSFQTSNHRFKSRKIRYRKFILVSILFYT